MNLKLIFLGLRLVVKAITLLESMEVSLWRKQLAAPAPKGAGVDIGRVFTRYADSPKLHGVIDDHGSGRTPSEEPAVLDRPETRKTRVDQVVKPADPSGIPRKGRK